MPLDNKSKQGSAIQVTMPWRLWLAEPDGSLDSGDLSSLLKLCSTPAPAEVVIIDVGLDCAHIAIIELDKAFLSFESC